VREADGAGDLKRETATVKKREREEGRRRE
jgi:hypothetical protein